tara:strand:+ start:776 stop:967 length:192 start_codon:yes stop_codon:yes gene_type:complete
MPEEVRAGQMSPQSTEEQARGAQKQGTALDGAKEDGESEKAEQVWTRFGTRVAKQVPADVKTC